MDIFHHAKHFPFKGVLLAGAYQLVAEIEACTRVQALDRWEERLENIWEGRPYDILDAALADTVARFPVHIQPFRDMIGGMRIDLVKSRYETFDELYEYMYRLSSHRLR